MLKEADVIRFVLSRLFSLRLIVVAMAVTLGLGLVWPEISDSLAFTGQLDRAVFDFLASTSGAGEAIVTEALSPEAFSRTLDQSGLLVPAWTQYSLAGALLLATLFLVEGLPRLGVVTGGLLTIVFAATLLVTQAAFMLYQQTWLPLGQCVLFLLGGFAIMLFWLQPHREIRALRDNAREARYQLGKLYLQQGQPAEALAALADCPADDDTLGLQYDIAIQQERKRQYESAIKTYSQILDQRKGFRDAAERLSALESLTSDHPPGPGSGFDSTRTLVMPDQAVTRPVLGRYEIEREIGRGAMGVVYLGKDPSIGRTVAIKTLSYQQFEDAELQDLKARFNREAKAAGRLNHPAIVTVYDVGEESDLAFIAMDYAPGKPLSAFATKAKLLPLPTVLELVARAADALDYAHRQKIVHRDIKPGNLIYNPKTGDLKITDFGIARITDDSRTRTGSVMGSPLYMSPEQLKGQKVTGASDIYSLGITLYKLVSGETPYNGDTLANLTYQILNKRPRSVREYNPELPNGVVRLINKAIQREPDKRFANAAEMGEAIRRLAARETTREAS